MNILIKINGINTFEIGIMFLAEFDSTTIAAIAVADGGKVM